MIQISGVFRLPSDGALAAFAETTPDFTLFGVRLLPILLLEDISSLPKKIFISEMRS